MQRNVIAEARGNDNTAKCPAQHSAGQLFMHADCCSGQYLGNWACFSGSLGLCFYRDGNGKIFIFRHGLEIQTDCSSVGRLNTQFYRSNQPSCVSYKCLGFFCSTVTAMVHFGSS